MAVAGCREEWDINCEEDRESPPPGVDPNEGWGFYQENFNNGGQRSIADGIKKAVVYAKYFLPRVPGHHFAGNYAGHRKHQADFDTDTHHDREGGAGGHCPESVTGEILYQAIYYFHQPVHHVKGQAAGNGPVVAFFILVGVYVENKHKHWNHIPLEVIAGPQNTEGVLGCLGVVQSRG